MKKTYLGSLILITSLLLVGTAQAETNDNVRELRTKNNTVRQENRENLGQPEDALEKMEEIRSELKQKIEIKQAEREEIQTARREALMEKLALFKDENKKQIVLHINEQLQQLNTNISEKLSAIIDRQAEILQRLIVRIETQEKNGQDVNELKLAVTQVQTDIEAAREAVLTQKNKIYTLEIQTETTAKNDVGATRQVLREDIKTVQEALKKVRESLRQILENLTEETAETTVVNN